MKCRILVVVYNLESAKEHEWFVDFIDKSVFEIEFVLIRKPDSALARFLESRGVKVHRLPYRGKWYLPVLTFRLLLIMLAKRYRIVHAHLFESSVAAMLASWIAGVSNRIVTRHHSDFHHTYFPGAVRFDKLVNSLATKIIAVSDVVYDVLIQKEMVNPDKVAVIYHGIDMDQFSTDAVSKDRIEIVRKKYGITGSAFVMGAISRFIQWKGVEYIIDAFKLVREAHPDTILVLANASGPFEETINRKLGSLDENSYRLITFEQDVPALYRCFDCFVHVPVSKYAEAFGQTYIESFAAEVPSVITLSGISHRIAMHGQNCLVVPYRDSAAIADAVLKLISDRTFAASLGVNARKSVVDTFTVAKKYHAIQALYTGLCRN